MTRSIGLVPQQESLFDDLTALEFVRIAAVLHHLPDPVGAARHAHDEAAAREDWRAALARDPGSEVARAKLDAPAAR